LLTVEDCYRCIPPGMICETHGSVPGIEFTAESCANLVRANNVPYLWCAWYADGDPVDRITHFNTCPTIPDGRVACGGGL